MACTNSIGWFARADLDLDASFAATDAFKSLPSQEEFLAAAGGLFSIVELALQSYAVQGSQILSGSFKADDTGVDEYIDKNPVIVDGDIIRILLTDRVRKTQSKTQSNLALNAQLNVADTTAPQAPISVRAIGSASDQIVVVWDPAVDNVGVRGYQVFRDGELIETTPYPVYTDTGLQTGTSYSYSIVAVDASGNLSDRSIAVLGIALATSDDQPPPAPTSLFQEEVVVDRIDLQWTQTDIADVASFNVYRGPTADAVQDLLVSVTSTFVTDATVSSGIQYCYQVAAVDASGNVSERSEAQCFQTPNGANSIPPDMESAVPPLAGLSLPDTENIDCAKEFNPGIVTQNTNLTEPCYLVPQDVQVTSFAHLSIAAGTILKFAPDTKLMIERDGTFATNGTAEAPVVLTGQQPVRGFWGGVKFSRSNSPKNLIKHTLVEYAGGVDVGAGITVSSAIGDKSRLRIENSLIRYSSDFGVSLPGLGMIMDSFSGNVITENWRPLFTNVTTLPALADANDLSGNDKDLVGISRFSNSQDTLIPDLGVPYLSNGITMSLNARLIIEAGVEIQFLKGSGMDIQGSVQAQGTVSQPIKLTAQVPAPGGWKGLLIRDNELSELNNLVIEFAGEPTETLVTGASLQLMDAKVAMSNVVLREGTGFGLYGTGDKTAFKRFDKVSIIRNAQTASLPIGSLHTLSASAVVQGNDFDQIDVTGNALIGTSALWHDLGVPYRFNGNYSIADGSVTIAPGVSLIAGNQSQIVVERSAYLNATGAANNIIKLMAHLPVAGTWGGLVYRSNNENNKLDQVVVENAGATTSNNPDIQQSGAVRLECTADFPATVSINNTDIIGSGSWGLFAEPQGCSVNQGANVRFIENKFGDSNLP